MIRYRFQKPKNSKPKLDKLRELIAYISENKMRRKALYANLSLLGLPYSKVSSLLKLGHLKRNYKQEILCNIDAKGMTESDLERIDKEISNAYKNQSGVGSKISNMSNFLRRMGYSVKKKGKVKMK